MRDDTVYYCKVCGKLLHGDREARDHIHAHDEYVQLVAHRDKDGHYQPVERWPRVKR